MTGASPDIAAPDGEAGGFGSLGSILYLLTLAWAAAIASFPINDNSFFTHLATGRIILDRGSVPSTDPYTFTAAGEPWTVQSWLASVAYAGAEQLGGVMGLRALLLVVFVVAMTVLWALAAPAQSVITRLGVVVGGLFVVTDLWGERPYMIGVIGLGALWLALDGRLSAWWSAPLMWVWVNAHGSFPLGLVLIALVVAGSWLDGRGEGSPPELNHELRVGKWALVGLAAAVVNPVGPRLLFFPLKAISQSAALDEIIEWNPPQFDSVAERAFLGLFLLSIIGVSKLGRWRFTLPLVVFGGAAVYAQRNVVMATMICIPVLAAAAPALGTLRTSTRPGLGRPVAVLAGALALLIAAAAVLSPATALGGYPARALAFEQRVLPAVDRRAAELFTGNLLEALDGPTGEVFVDDRADMFPSAVFDDYLALARAAPGWQDRLDRYGINRIVWARDSALATVLATSPQWQVIYSDTAWTVVSRRSVN